MAIEFPRSVRALRNDRFRPSLAALTVTTVLLGAWLIWFFFSQIAVYESSTTFTLQSNGLVSATFPARVSARVMVDQPASVRLDVPGEPSITYSGRVARVNAPRGASEGTVEIYFDADGALPANAEGVVQVQVESVSPAALVIQAVRQSAQASSPAAPAPARGSIPF